MLELQNHRPQASELVLCATNLEGYPSGGSQYTGHTLQNTPNNHGSGWHGPRKASFLYTGVCPLPCLLEGVYRYTHDPTLVPATNIGFLRQLGTGTRPHSQIRQLGSYALCANTFTTVTLRIVAPLTGLRKVDAKGIGQSSTHCQGCTRSSQFVSQ